MKGTKKSAVVRVSKPRALSLAKIGDQVARHVADGNLSALRDLHAKTRGIEAYVRALSCERQGGLAAQNGIAAAVIQIERGLGTLCAQIAVETQSAGLKQGPRSAKRAERAKLTDLGISHKASARWQKLAAIPDDVLEAHIAAVQAKCAKITTSGAIAATSDAAGYDGDEWGTPERIVQAARDVLGEIELDPASNAKAQEIVRAERFYTKDDDGLVQPWSGRAWMNPPYSDPLIEQFTSRLLALHDAGDVPEAITIVNNATDTTWCQALLARLVVCLPKGRVAFLNAEGKPVRGTRQGQAIFYAGDEPENFAARFAEFGAVLRPFA